MVAAPSKKTALTVDRDQARTQLELLGYKPGDNVYMRFFVPDGDPRHGTPAAARKAEKLNWEEVERYQNDGYGIYFVVNGGGHKDKDVLVGRSLFCEWDDRPIEDQILAWQELNLPEPSMQVGTRKSVHNYWRADLTKEQWVELQEDLLSYTQSDQKLKNPSRVLRLAGAWHIKPGCEPIRCDIIHQTERIYSYEELRAAIPQRRSREQPTINYQTSIADDVPLYQFLTLADRQLIDIGATPGSRNTLGAKLSRNLLGTVARLGQLGIRFSGDPRQLFDEYCQRCNPSLSAREGEAIWKSAERDKPSATLTDDALQNCAKAWARNQKSPRRGYGDGGDHTKQNASVTGDSHSSGDSHNVDTMSIAATVTTVTKILKSGLPDWLELNKLEAVRVNSELSNKQAFYALVSGIKSQFDEVQPDDEVRLRALIDWHNAELDFHQALPSMADDILHDAKVLNIDPIGIWQYLLPAVLSMAGKRVNLDIESHEIPAIAWTAILAESGTGKTRAEKLVTSPLKQLQKQAKERFLAELEEWEETTANWEKGNGKKPPKPVERKYLFDVATIQAVMRRQSEQGMNGSLWARDELVGVFQSFGQFNKGENEALTCLLASWDGGNSQVDRVNQEDSYLIESSRLSIAGGLQPGIFKKAFKDPNDSQGLQARFLFAEMKPKKPKRVKGFCHLSEKLPAMYKWLDTLPEGKIKLSVEADRYYDKLYETIGEQALNTSMPAIRAWMFKLPAQLLRIALGLHLIECYHDQNRPLWTMQKDTVERAVLFAQYYRSAFHIVQTTAADTDDLSAILLQIWDKAVTRHPEGISTRDAYREIKAIQSRAKDAGRLVGAYTADLFSKLQQMGKGSVVKNGRLIKFVANLTPPPISPDDNGGTKPESPPPGDRVTVAEMLDISTSELSPEVEVSPVTFPSNVMVDVLHNEVPEETEEETSLGQIPPTSADEIEEAIASTTWEQKYTKINVDKHGWGEIVRRVPPQASANSIENAPQATEAEVDEPIPPAPTAAIAPDPWENALEVMEAVADDQTPQTSTAKPAHEAIPVADDEWQKGWQVVVDASDLPPSLQKFHGLQGVIEAVGISSCLVRFTDESMQYVMFRGLRRA